VAKHSFIDRSEGLGRGGPSKTERARFLDQRERRAKDESERIGLAGTNPRSDDPNPELHLTKEGMFGYKVPGSSAG